MLKQFYEDVRGPEWPNIDTYTDYFRLPPELKNECNQEHNLQQRFDEIESRQYWQNLLLYGYRYKNLVFVPAPSRVSNYYSELFGTQLGWQRVQLTDVTNDDICFGFMSDPFSRYYRNVTAYIQHIFFEIGKIDHTVTASSPISKVLFSFLTDNIAIPMTMDIPYTDMYGEKLKQICWIPDDLYTDNEIEDILSKLFKIHGNSVDLTPAYTQAQLLDLIKNIHTQSNGIYTTYILLAPDLTFYRTLLENFNPNWE